MPEEHNRVLTDHANDLVLVPTEGAMRHLADERLGEKAVFVGDVMVDVCLRVAKAVAGRPVSTLAPGMQAGHHVAATVHRAENTDDPARLRTLLHALSGLSLPVVIPVHPRLQVRAAAAEISLTGGSLVPIEPLPYPEMVLLLSQARSVLTDSGGLQKEALTLGVPCTTLRTETEWVETLTDGRNVLAADAVDLDRVALRARPSGEPPRPYGDGESAKKVLAALGG